MTDENTTMTLEEALNASIAESGDDFSMSGDRSARAAIAKEPDAEPAEDVAEADETPEGDTESEEVNEADADDTDDAEGDDEPDEPADDDDEKPALELSEDEQRQTVRWSKEHKDLFGSLAPEARAMMLDRFKDADARVTQATQEASELRKTWSEIDSILAPVRGAMKAQGVNDQQYVRNLVDWAKFVARDPKAGIAGLMKAEKLSIEDIEQAISDGTVDQAIATYSSEQRAQHAYHQGRAQADAAYQTQTSINEFAAAKDDAGQPKHPHFEAVRGEMARLIQSGFAADLESAYDQAVRLSPDTYAQEVARQAAAQQERAREAAKQAEAAKAKAERARAQKARRATGVRTSATSPARTGQSTATDLDSIVAEQMAHLGMQ